MICQICKQERNVFDDSGSIRIASAECGVIDISSACRTCCDSLRDFILARGWLPHVTGRMQPEMPEKD